LFEAASGVLTPDTPSGLHGGSPLKINRILLLAALALIQIPLEARAAASSDGDTEYCGTPYPFWWRFDGLRSDIVVDNWEIVPVGESFRLAVTLVNRGTATFEGGMGFMLTHAAVDPAGYADPASMEPPASARAQLGAEALTGGTLPTLRPGERTVVEAGGRLFRKDANHILTLSFYDGSQVQIDPQPNSWYWLRVLSPRANPGALALTESLVVPTTSRREGYSASRVELSLKNVSREVLEAGTPISVIHGPSGSAGGYWGPDDTIDPHDPGNPYASFFREYVFQGRLDRALNPGEVIQVGGLVNVPEGFTAHQQMTVVVGH
jgi:hypothetical protein